ncbi:MAG: response regulator [Nitrospirae bacterium]|nr:response regulator [Nitrospirota bacterium]
MALLSFLSTAIGGYFYYSSLKENAFSDTYQDAEGHTKTAVDRVSSKLTEYQKAARAAAGLKILQIYLADKNNNNLAEANTVLDHFQNSLDVDVCYLMDRSGNTIASSNRDAPDSFVGKNYAFRPYFRQAMSGAAAVYMALGVTSQKRGIYFSHPVYRTGVEGPSGVFVIKASIEPIEKVFSKISDGIFLMTDPHGVIFASNRNEWLYRVLWKIPPEEASEIAKTQQFGEGPWEWTGITMKDVNHAVDRSGVTYMVHQMEITKSPGWKIIYLWDIRAVSEKLINPLVRTAGYIIMALCVVIGLSVFFLYKKASGDIIARRLAEEKLSTAYEELENRVTERTTDLNQANTQLKAEILERSRMEDALAEGEAKFRKLSQEFQALLDAIPDNIILQAKDFRVTWANRSAVMSLKMDASSLQGHYCYALWHERTAPCENCPVEKTFLTGNPESAEIKTPDGSAWEMRTVPVMNDDGDVINVIKVVRNITEHRKLEEQLRHAQKMEAVGTLTGGVAHDFNNILTAIINYANLLKMKIKMDDPLLHYIDQILSITQRGANITQSLLAFSRKQVMTLRETDINRLIADTAKFLQKLIGETIELQIKFGDENLTVLADAYQIEQVLFNLATNARDAMPQGGILAIETGSVKIEKEFIESNGFGLLGTYALISVADTGEGMNEDMIERIFEPFYTTKEMGKGTGLGLAISYGIVKQHNGYIKVYTGPGKGTAFKIYLPLINRKAEDLKHQETVSLPVGTETVLLAEDEAEVREALGGILREYGYTVIEAVDGQDAVEKFMENRDRIHVLLFDVVMPGKNGREAYDEIKLNCPDVKAVFMSGYASDIITTRGIVFDDRLNFLAKPVSPDVLLKTLRQVLEGN